MTISGKLNSNQRSAIQYFADKLISKQMQRHISIRVYLTRYAANFGETHIVGYNEKDQPREFTLEIRSKLCEKEKLRTIAHEIVHVKQYLYKELNEQMTLWKGQKVDSDAIPYFKQPWEIEAHELGDKLYEEYMETVK